MYACRILKHEYILQHLNQSLYIFCFQHKKNELNKRREKLKTLQKRHSNTLVESEELSSDERRYAPTPPTAPKKYKPTIHRQKVMKNTVSKCFILMLEYVAIKGGNLINLFIVVSKNE